jgi:hypothetical protein
MQFLILYSDLNSYSSIILDQSHIGLGTFPPSQFIDSLQQKRSAFRSFDLLFT